jgi:phosphatidylinositol alpha-1,6-mannosyltransferase
MKIMVLATTWFPPKIGGESTILYNMPNYIRGDEFVFLAQRLEGAEKFDNDLRAKIYRPKWVFSKNKIVSRLFRLVEPYRIIRREKPDVLLVGNGDNAFWAKNLNRLIKIPYVVLLHGTELLNYGRRDGGISEKKDPLSLARTLIANSEYTKSLAMKSGINASQIAVLHPGCDPEVFKPGLPVDDLKKHLGLENRKIVLTVGSLVQRKGHDKTIEAINLLRDEIPNISYLIVGEGIYKKTLEDLVLSRSLQNHVKFIGSCSDADLPRYYNLCDVFVMASREMGDNVEGFGMVFIEAGACGKPVVGGRSGGISDAVLDQKTGILVNPSDPSEIANAIKSLIKDPSLSMRLGETARKRVLEECNWTSYYSKLKDILHKASISGTS